MAIARRKEFLSKYINRFYSWQFSVGGRSVSFGPAHSGKFIPQSGRILPTLTVYLEKNPLWMGNGAACPPLPWVRGLPAWFMAGLPAWFMAGLPAWFMAGLPAWFMAGLPAWFMAGLPAVRVRGLGFYCFMNLLRASNNFFPDSGVSTCP
jgi:hypothetical protein